jgi:Fe-S-cluster-containing dehydrogenase component/CRP-like cAMP-binding protein
MPISESETGTVAAGLRAADGAEPETGVQQPRRWDVPFGEDMTDQDVDRILSLPPFNRIDPSRFPNAIPLRGILRNDSRMVRYKTGDLIVREGDYGHSAFFIVSGSVRVFLDPLPGMLLGRRAPQKQSLWQALGQLWRNPGLPETRRAASAKSCPGAADDSGRAVQPEDHSRSIFLQDFPVLIEKKRTRLMTAGEVFGEIAALGRTPRTATVVAGEPTELLELRWQGLRDIRARDPELKAQIDQRYRQRSLLQHLRETPSFRHLDDEVLQKLADLTRFETHGNFDWYGTYKHLCELAPAERLQHEPVIAQEGNYPNGLILIRAGFARLSERYNNGERTVSYLGRGQAFGTGEILRGWRTGEPVPLQRTLRAVGYVDILNIPTAAIEELVLPTMSSKALAVWGFADRDAPPVEFVEKVQGRVDPEIIEFLVDNRFFNGTAAMLIDLDRCTRCDDCVRACAAAHDNNPRFVRHGPQHDRFMIANACMHCVDPVCMIGCPTGAIHRESAQGQVVINDQTCIGCATCANSCPYNNIQMVEIRDRQGNFFSDRNTHLPIQKAAKCDLCVDQPGGPCCERACPHDALVRIDLSNLNSIARWLDR